VLDLSGAKDKSSREKQRWASRRVVGCQVAEMKKALVTGVERSREEGEGRFRRVSMVGRSGSDGVVPRGGCGEKGANSEREKF
jgi:hypothetical protein